MRIGVAVQQDHGRTTRIAALDEIQADASRQRDIPIVPVIGHDPRRGQRDIGTRPGTFESLLHIGCFGCTTLCAQTLAQSEQRPAVLTETLQVLAIHGFSLRRAPGFEQHRAQDLTRRMMPHRRLVVRDTVLDLHGFAHQRNRGAGISLAQLQLALEHARRDLQVRQQRQILQRRRKRLVLHRRLDGGELSARAIELSTSNQRQAACVIPDADRIGLV